MDDNTTPVTDAAPAAELADVHCWQLWSQRDLERLGIATDPSDTWRKIHQPDRPDDPFPSPIKTGRSQVRFRAVHVIAWLERRVEASPPPRIEGPHRAFPNQTPTTRPRGRPRKHVSKNGEQHDSGNTEAARSI